MISRHPTNERIIDFAQGVITGGEALLIAAHCDMCPHCAEKLRLYTEEFAEKELAEVDNVISSPAFTSMLASITQQPVAERIVAREPEEFIELDGVGHCPQDEAPELVNPILSAWIERKIEQKNTP